jgi:hypothetical protein
MLKDKRQVLDENEDRKVVIFTNLFCFCLQAQRHNTDFTHDEEWRGRGDRALVLDPVALENAVAERRALIETERKANTAKIAARRLQRGIDRDARKNAQRAKKTSRQVQPVLPV